MIATVTSGVGRPADDEPLVGDRPVRRGSGRRGGIVEIIIGASVCPNSWAITGPIRVSASSSRVADIGAAPYQKHCSDERSAAVEPRVVEHHVDQRRRQERVGDAVPLDEPEEAADVRGPHHHDLAAVASTGKQSTPAAWVSGASAR